MPDSLEGILLVMGGLFLLVGLIGGEFEVSVAKIPRVGTPGRIGAIAVGVVCLTLALQSIIAGRSPSASADPSATVQQNVATPAAIAPSAAPVPAATPRPATEECISGFVWREARPSDLVCVTLDTRTRTAEENAAADSNRQPGGGEYGPNTCRAGLVWRVAFDGDVVCVTPASRDQAQEDNNQSPNRKAH